MSFDQDGAVSNRPATALPGAMTTVMAAMAPQGAGPRELRVGRVEGGAILEDRRHRASLSYGRSERASLMIPGAAERCAPLFERSATGVFTLLVPHGARGRLALTAGTFDLAQLAGTAIPLDASARGKLVIGETTLLFQLVPAAGAPLRPRLSSAARGGLLGMIDWRFTSYVMASLCAHLFFVAWLDSADFAIDASATMLPEQITRLLVEMPDPPPVPDTDEVPSIEDAVATNDVAETPSRPSQPTRERTGPATPSTQPMSAEQTARVAAEAGDTARQLLVGAFGGASDSAFADVLHSAATDNAQAILDGVRGVGIATGPAGALHARAGGGNGSGESGTLGALAASGRGATEQRGEGSAVIEQRVVYTITEPDLPIPRSGDRDPEDVVRMLRARRQAFQACYENRTRINPDLRGKIGVLFTISEMGTVSDVRVTENGTDDTTLGACIAATFQRIRFGEVADSGDSTFSHAFVFAPQN